MDRPNATATRRGAWTKVGRVFTPPLDMSACGALGVWIYGDGKGELLNFQLNNSREYYTGWDDHYVDVNFTGWRYYELLLRERDAQRHQDYVWPYGGALRSGADRPFSAIVSEASTSTTTTCRRTRTCACFCQSDQGLAGREGKLSNPTVVINGQRSRSRWHWRAASSSSTKAPPTAAGTTSGAIIQQIAPQGDVPMLAAGENAVSFTL